MSSDASSQAAETAEKVKFGELIVLGYNGHLISGDKGRRRSKYILWKREKANGVKPSQRHLVTNPQASKAVQDQSKHSVSYTLSRNKAIIVEYLKDDDTDMFQIGRSMEGPIDFVVMDTVPGHLRNQRDTAPQSTISRFACRILVDRSPPYTARIYAAGFDSGKNIFLGFCQQELGDGFLMPVAGSVLDNSNRDSLLTKDIEKAVKWYSDDNVDGLTTNGVFIMQPQGGFTPAGKPGPWREVSVGGGLFSLRDSRPSPLKSHQMTEEDNVLRDGTLIDLCGATIVWRSALGLISSPSENEFQQLVGRLNAGRPQCPVGLNTLVLPTRGSLNLRDRQPYVYLPCGHVHGNHEWGQADTNIRKCPLCLMDGSFVKLQMGCELSLYVDSEQPTYCFSPCGHMVSECTAKFWSRIAVPHGSHGFQTICPFCATPLLESTPFVKLIFQDNTDLPVT